MNVVGKNVLSSEDYEIFYKAFTHVLKLIHDEKIFKLLSLVLLLDVKNMIISPGILPLVQLRLTFLKLLKRRFLLFNQQLNYEEFQLAVRYMSDISKTLGLFLKSRQVQKSQ